jgi:hypothetical protein
MLPLWTVAPGNGCGKVDVSAGVPAVRKIFSCGNGGRKGSAYIKDVAEAMRKGGDIEPKNLLLTCGKVLYMKVAQITRIRRWIISSIHFHLMSKNNRYIFCLYRWFFCLLSGS